MAELRRVAITGMGIVSCLGNRLDDVAAALREGRSGIHHIPEYAERGLKTQVAGVPVLDGLPPVHRRHRRFMGDVAHHAYAAMRAAIDDSGLEEADIRDFRSGLIAGSGVGSVYRHHQAMEVAQLEGAHKVSPFAVPQIMGSTVSAALSTAFGITGPSYSMTSACATSAHCIGHGMELIQLGKQDIVFAGGAEELAWTTTIMFDAMGALSSSFNDTPKHASRPYDVSRDGFIIAGGAGMLVLEELGHALRRGARIYGELAGYGATSDGQDMLTPSVDGAARAMRLATADLDIPLDYINTHATSTRAGDMVEVEAMLRAFDTSLPSFSSTKGLTGHPIGAAGAHEAIYTLLMMRDGFAAGCANLENTDALLDDLPLIRTTSERQINAAMSNSFGFGGTNACLVFRRFNY
jgi:3-oxoacyl-[acyl-carrier-protein] synthase-1